MFKKSADTYHKKSPVIFPDKYYSCWRIASMKAQDMHVKTDLGPLKC